MAPPSDPRRVVGNIIHAKAIHVTNLAECSRRYDARKKIEKLQGVFNELIVSREGARSTTTIVATFDLGGNFTKSARLNSRLIIAGPPPNDSEENSLSSTPLG